MKSALHACTVGLFAVLFTLSSAGKLTRPGAGLIGKFYASGVKGDVTVISDGRILSLKKGDSYLARGDTIETAKGATATIVYSNGTAVFIDEDTRFIVEKFDQEFFAPNNNLRVEPSNSSTVVKLVHGRVVISTPRLLSGTTMFYQTPHAAISIRGEKVLIETNEKQTHVAMITGNATVNPRDTDGNFVSLGKRLTTGQEAYVKFTIAAKTSEADETAKSTAATETGNASKPGSLAIGAQLAPDSTIAPVTKDGEAIVVRLSGPARATLPKATHEIELKEGTKLPPGTLIETGKETDLYLQPLTGVIADLRPSTTIQLERISVTMAGDVVKRQSALLDLKAGTVVSTIDPALRAINDYGVRTPKGIAKAGGTSFTASVSEDGYSIATTADTVSFVTPAGTAYTINAGQVTITPAGGDPQPPIALSAAVAANPAFATDIRGALNSVTTVVQSNLGGLSPDSALDLVSKVASTAAAALPSQAADLSTQVVAAVTAPSAATSSNVAAAAQAVTNAIVAAAPGQASQVAAAAVVAAPSLA
ncbi:MAG TPA: FecR family protein, partial [Opitutus sp.]|nr:FecR family protein [Opitutus sp.]